MDTLSMSNRNFTNNTTSFLDLDFQTPILIFSILIVLPENAYVIWLIVTGAGNGVASEFFSLNLSVCEIVFCLLSFFSLLCRAFQEIWFIVGFLSGFTGRPLFQCLMCVECYLAVVHPVTFLKYKPLRYKVICAAVAWIMILMSCVFYCLAVIQMYLFMWWYLCQALPTFSIMFFCCLAVLRALKQSGPGERMKERGEENHIKRKASNIIVKIIMAMLLIYASHFLTGLSYILTHEINSGLLVRCVSCWVVWFSPSFISTGLENYVFCKVPLAL